MLTWKIVEVSKVSVLYRYIDYIALNQVKRIGEKSQKGDQTKIAIK